MQFRRRTTRLKKEKWMSEYWLLRYVVNDVLYLCLVEESLSYEDLVWAWIANQTYNQKVCCQMLIIVNLSRTSSNNLDQIRKV